MSTHRVTKTQPIERWGQIAPTADNVGAAWSTSCTLCPAKLSRKDVRRIHTGGGAYLNVCGACKATHTTKKAIPAKGRHVG